MPEELFLLAGATRKQHTTTLETAAAHLRARPPQLDGHLTQEEAKGKRGKRVSCAKCFQRALMALLLYFGSKNAPNVSGSYFNVCLCARVRAVGFARTRPRTSLFNVVSLCCFLSRVFVQLNHQLFFFFFLNRFQSSVCERSSFVV